LSPSPETKTFSFTAASISLPTPSITAGSGGRPFSISSVILCMTMKAHRVSLLAGYAIFDVPSKAVAIEWAMRFGDIVKVHEVEVRQMPEW
jgi:hypothetical protein